MDTNITQNLTTIEDKRKFLRKLSESVSTLVEAGEYETVNEAVVDTFYKNGEHTQFRTFNDWKSEGYSIKKGSKTFIVWGRPKAMHDAKRAEEAGKEEPATDDSKRDFFPIAFLFSNAQVEVKKGDKRNV